MTLHLGALIDHAMEAGASDLYLAVGSPPLLRVGGELRGEGDPLSAEQTRVLMDQHAPDHARTRLEECGGCCFTLDLGSESRVRVGAYRHQDGVNLVLRLLRSPSSIEEISPVVSDVADALKGLVLIGGTSGSGRSTTAACLIESINARHARRIVTVERCIEHRFTPKLSVISQREVGRDTESISRAIRASHGVDVLYLDDALDAHTLLPAMRAACDGSALVIATTTGRDCIEMLRILQDMLPSEDRQFLFLLSMTLVACFVPTLVPTLAGRQTVACEVLVGTEAARNHIREDQLHRLYSIMGRGGKDGMRTLDQSLVELVVQGVVDQAAAADRAPERWVFEAALKKRDA